MNTKRILSFITKKVEVEINPLSTPTTGTTILVIQCINNASRMSSDTSYETYITRNIWISEQIHIFNLYLPKFLDPNTILLKYS